MIAREVRVVLKSWVQVKKERKDLPSFNTFHLLIFQNSIGRFVRTRKTWRITDALFILLSTILNNYNPINEEGYFKYCLHSHFKKYQLYLSTQFCQNIKIIKCQSSTVIHNYGWMMCIHYMWRTNKTLNSLTNPYSPLCAFIRKRGGSSLVCFLLECYYPSPLELKAKYFGLSIVLQSSVVKMNSLYDIHAFVLLITVQLTLSITGVVCRTIINLINLITIFFLK